MIFTTYKDRYHDSWIPAYDTTHAYHSPNLYEWLLLQRKPEVVTALNEIPKKPTFFTTHPNPAVNSVTISYHGGTMKAMDITISDMAGVTVLHQSFRSGTFDISNLSPGVYVVRLSDSSGFFATNRLIKNR
jgi:hypothetical protein